CARPGRSNLYLVLLDYRDRRGGPHGLYVGMSHYTPAQRFDQHKAGIRAAGSVLQRGLEVLSGPTLHLQRIARAEAARIEVQLADSIAGLPHTMIRSAPESRAGSPKFRDRRPDWISAVRRPQFTFGSRVTVGK